MLSIIFGVYIGSLLGNFTYQAFTKRDWDDALCVSYFQAIPLLVVALMTLWG